jgi:hypothetical protein
MPRQPAPQSSLVGAAALGVGAQLGRRPFPGAAHAPPVVSARVDSQSSDWAPRICFVQAGSCAESLAFELGSPELAAFSPAVLVAGEVGSQVTLRWSLWSRVNGWHEMEPDIPVTVGGDEIDPEAPDPGAIHTIPQPPDLPSDGAAQILLHAERSYERVVDGVSLRVRSNPLLISIYPGTGS